MVTIAIVNSTCSLSPEIKIMIPFATEETVGAMQCGTILLNLHDCVKSVV